MARNQRFSFVFLRHAPPLGKAGSKGSSLSFQPAKRKQKCSRTQVARVKWTNDGKELLGKGYKWADADYLDDALRSTGPRANTY